MVGRIARARRRPAPAPCGCRSARCPSTASHRPERCTLRGWNTTSPSDRMHRRPQGCEAGEHVERARVEPVGERVVDQERRRRQQVRVVRVLDAIALERAEVVARSRARRAAPRRWPSSAPGTRVRRSCSRCRRRSSGTRSLSSRVLSTSTRKTTGAAALIVRPPAVCSRASGCRARGPPTQRLAAPSISVLQPWRQVSPRGRRTRSASPTRCVRRSRPRRAR